MEDDNKAMDLFYTPQYAKTGDVIPYYDEETKRFENFYLKNWNPDAPKEQVVYGWHRITTTDNRHYEEIPTGIHGGTDRKSTRLLQSRMRISVGGVWV